MHRLQTAWTFYFQRSTEGESWSSSIHKIDTFSTCEEFWRLYSHLQTPDQLDPTISLHLFRDGLRAVWEDEQMRDGGYFQIHAEPSNVRSFWETTVLNLIGEQFAPEVCGAVVSLRRGQYFVQLWHRAVEDETARTHICLSFVTFLGIQIKGKKTSLSYQLFSGTRCTSRYIVDENGIEKEREHRRRKGVNSSPHYLTMPL
jgi:translation initiation factor 4E